MSSRTLKGLTALTLSTSLLAFSTPAMAQLDEIVVTAQKREQNLQDVPLSINAFDLEALESKRIQGLEDIAEFAPGVYTTPNPADENGVRVNIRGIGTFDPQIGQDSRTAIYVDGVYYGRTQGLAFDSPDLGRVEILKGPQGTLYGRNTVAGAVNIISVAPDPSEQSGAIDLEYGNFDHVRAKGHLNVPLTDAAALRISGLFSDTDGWVENTGAGENFGGTERIGGRAALRVEATEKLTLDIAADYTNTRSTPLFEQALPGTSNISPDTLQPGFLSFALTPSEDLSRQDEVFSFADIEEGESEVFGITGSAQYEVNETDSAKLTLAYRQADSRRFVSLAPTANPAILNAITGGFNQALAPLPFAFNTALLSNPAGPTLRPDFATEFDGTPPENGLFLSPPGGASTLAGHEQFSAELTYTGSWGDKIDYTGGLFYYNEETGNDDGTPPNTNDANAYLFVLGAFARQLTPLATQNFLSGIIPGSLVTPGPNPGIGCLLPAPPGGLPFIPGTQTRVPCLGPIPAAGALLGTISNPQTPAFLQPVLAQNLQSVIGVNANFLEAARSATNNTLEIDTEAFAIYGELTYHISDDLRITGGLRYSDDNKDGVGQPVSAFFFDNTSLLGNPILPNIASSDTTSLDPSVVLEWDATDDILLYASYKESFRSGGFNQSAIGTRQAGETFGNDFVFEDETISAYEVGFKSDLFDNRLRLNAAGYYYDFNDFQTTVTLNPLTATERAVVNTDQEIWGADVELLFAVTEDFIINGAYSYVDGNQDPVTNPGTGVVTQQEGLQGTPENSFAVGFDYNRELSEIHDLFVNGTYSYKEGALGIPPQGQAAQINLSSQSLLSGRIGVNFEAGGQDVSVSLWGQNLLDDEYTIGGLPFNTFAFNTAVFGQPRTYGVAAGVKF